MSLCFWYFSCSPHQVVQLDWQSGGMLLADGTALRARFVIATIPVGAINDHVASSTLFVPPLPQVLRALELYWMIRLTFRRLR